MAGMFGIVQIVGIVDNAFDVAFVVAHFHVRFKDIFTHVFMICYLSVHGAAVFCLLVGEGIHSQCGSADSLFGRSILFLVG